MFSERDARRVGVAALGALAIALIALPAYADDDDDGLTLPSGPRISAEGEEGEDWRPNLDPDLPRYRIELTWRIPWVVSSKFKRGNEQTAHEVEWRKDTNSPGIPGVGWRMLLEVRFTKHVVVGGYFTAVHFRGPRRAVHHKGLGINDVQVPGGTVGRSSLDIYAGEVFLRYAMRDNQRLKFAFGIGVAAVSYRYRFDGNNIRANARIDTYWGPTISYVVQFALWDQLHIFLESSFGIINPTRFPSYYSEWRAGLRVPINDELELILAGSQLGGQVEDLQDLTKGRSTTGHRWKQASYTILGLEFGLAYRF